ncbi:MAG: hypothetical protein JNK82_03910, partial [Myxococcaceae bacterium]|nr:hypothetical protein [Myxococcaceae bacterium]
EYPLGERQRAMTSIAEEHVLLIELQSGERRSLCISEELACAIVKGDVGVAYFKQGVLFDFKPIAQ